MILDPMSSCAQCHAQEMVTDWASGDTICSRCGLVASERLIDERSERRYLGDESVVPLDRHGGAQNSLRTGVDSTVVGSGNRRRHNRTHGPPIRVCQRTTQSGRLSMPQLADSPSPAALSPLADVAQRERCR